MEEYELPDGRKIKVGGERFGAPECLFQPHLVNREGAGVAELLFQCINAADIDTRAEFYKHIVLSGGTTMYPGLPSRLEREMKQLYLDRILKGDTSRLANFKIRIEVSSFASLVKRLEAALTYCSSSHPTRTRRAVSTWFSLAEQCCQILSKTKRRSGFHGRSIKSVVLRYSRNSVYLHERTHCPLTSTSSRTRPPPLQFGAPSPCTCY